MWQLIPRGEGRGRGRAESRGNKKILLQSPRGNGSSGPGRSPLGPGLGSFLLKRVHIFDTQSPYKDSKLEVVKEELREVRAQCLSAGREEGQCPTPLQAHTSPSVFLSLWNSLIACSFRAGHQFDLSSRAQARLTLFGLNNTGSAVIDSLSAAGKWLRHGQKPHRVPEAQPVTGPASGWWSGRSQRRG